MIHLRFTKMNGAGNDFVLLDNRDGSITLEKSGIARLCDRHRGIGADGVLCVETAEHSGADFRMRYYNADGGEAEMCGNGARCFARFAQRIASSGDGKIAFETPAGLIRATVIGERVELQMSAPFDFAEAVDLEVGFGSEVPVHFINTGVPHAVVFAENLGDCDVAARGSAIRRHPHFAPVGTNVNFVSVMSPTHLAVRTYERGVEAETLACGTGVVACALIHHIESGTPSPIAVDVRGGETLEVAFQPMAARGVFTDVILKGPADFVFEGSIDLTQARD